MKRVDKWMAKLIPGLISDLILAFKRKKELVHTFTLYIDKVPDTLRIIISQESESIFKVTIKDIANKQQKEIRIKFNDSVEHLLFLLSLIRDEYKSKILFTSKSNIL